MSIRLSFLAAVALLSPFATVSAEVRVITGRTPIPEGNARRW
jgi:hypothetical protein